jgi:hypothetical protein
MMSKRKAVLALLAALGMILPGTAMVSFVGAAKVEGGSSVHLAPLVPAEPSGHDQADTDHDPEYSSASRSPSLAGWAPLDDDEFEGNEDSVRQLVAPSPPAVFARLSRPDSDASADVFARPTRAPRGPPNV